MEPFAAYLLVGIVIVLLGFLSIRKGSHTKNRCTASASAVIVEVQAEKDEAGSENTHKKYTYTPIYEFVVNGNTIRKSGGVYSHNKKQFKVGDTATVKYWESIWHQMFLKVIRRELKRSRRLTRMLSAS